jgi:hypothetical protein
MYFALPSARMKQSAESPSSRYESDLKLFLRELPTDFHHDSMTRFQTLSPNHYHLLLYLSPNKALAANEEWAKSAGLLPLRGWMDMRMNLLHESKLRRFFRDIEQRGVDPEIVIHRIQHVFLKWGEETENYPSKRIKSITIAIAEKKSLIKRVELSARLLRKQNETLQTLSFTLENYKEFVTSLRDGIIELEMEASHYPAWQESTTLNNPMPRKLGLQTAHQTWFVNVMTLYFRTYYQENGREIIANLVSILFGTQLTKDDIRCRTKTLRSIAPTWGG